MGSGNKPTDRQVWYMKLLAKNHNVSIQQKELTNVGLADKFIKKYAKMPTTKAVNWARKLANDKKITLYDIVLKEKAITSEFIDMCLGGSEADLKAYLRHYNRKTNAEEEYEGPQ